MHDLKHQKIGGEILQLYKTISDANTQLSELRKQCEHPHTSKGDYAWAPGHITFGVDICDVCGEVIEEIEAQIVDNLTAVQYTQYPSALEIGSEHYLDLGSQAPVHVKVIAVIQDQVICEYLASTPGRTEVLSRDLFPNIGFNFFNSISPQRSSHL